MSYRESDMTQLISYILAKSRELPNQLFLGELVRKAGEFFRSVPLYPGIVRACLGKVIQQTEDPSHVVPGSRVIVRDGGKFIVGTILESRPEGMLLDRVVTLESLPQLWVEHPQLQAIVRENVLQEDWPSLIFEESRS